MANSVEPDETDHYEPSLLDLHFLPTKLFGSTGPTGLKELMCFPISLSVLYAKFSLYVCYD